MVVLPYRSRLILPNACSICQQKYDAVNQVKIRHQPGKKKRKATALLFVLLKKSLASIKAGSGRGFPQLDSPITMDKFN